MQAIRLFIINGNQTFRRGLASLFDAQGSFRVVDDSGPVVSMDDLRRLQPDVVLFGPDDEKNFSFIRAIKETCPCTLVIVLSDLNEQQHVQEAFAAGADGYIKTPILPADLTASVELTCRAGICFFPRTAKKMLLMPGDFHRKHTGNGESQDECRGRQESKAAIVPGN